MALVSTSQALQLLPILFLLLLITRNGAVTFTIINRCSYTVWPAALPVGGGRQLEPGQAWVLEVPAATMSGRIWARTGCSFDGSGNGTCQTGGCGGVLACTGFGQPPVTLAELTIGLAQTSDYFDISVIDGFNIPMEFLPVLGKGEQGCSRGPRCAANITLKCPSVMKVPGGCNNMCTGNTSSSCTYSGFFKQMCPDAYSLLTDSATFTCPTGTNYQVVFCPSINLAVPPTSTKARRTKHIIISRVIAVVATGFILLTMIFIVTCYIRKRKAQRARRHQEMEEEFGELQGMPTRFTFQQLQVATMKFTEKLGEGGFGSVFKGQIGEERIAVKRLDLAGQGKREFSAEVQTIGSIHHINLARLIGFCAEKSHRLLVYEYMPNGSLDKWIYSQHDKNISPLDWSTRCKIITHIAKGLSYLHEDCTKRIAHLDVKPQNILLDDNFNAKLSDFGLCKLIDRDMSQVVTRMRGTPGYLAPEWLTSQITEKADVYSFGVVVMEIVSGRKSLDNSRSEESIHLISLLEEKVKSDCLVDLVDKHSNDMEVHKQEAIQMMKLAMWCLQFDCKRRPKMYEVIKVLEGTMDIETNMDHNFVATCPANFGMAGSPSSSAPPQASDVSGPR